MATEMPSMIAKKTTSFAKETCWITSEKAPGQLETLLPLLLPLPPPRFGAISMESKSQVRIVLIVKVLRVYG